SGLLARTIVTTAKRAGRTDETTAQQQQAGGFRNFGLWARETTKTPLIDVTKRGSVQAVDGDAVNNGPFRCLDAKEVLTIRIDRKHLVENLPAGERVVHGEVHLSWRRQAVGDVDVQNQLRESDTVFEL